MGGGDVYIYQLAGSASVLGSTRTSHCGPHTISARQGMILPKQRYTRYTMHIRMITRTSQVRIFPAFKHHTFKKMFCNTLRVPEHIRKMFDQVMISDVQTHQSSRKHITILAEQACFSVLSLNVQVNVKSRHRPLQCLLRQHSYPLVIFLQEIGKIPDKYVFHPLYAACYTPLTANSSGVAILIRRVSQFCVLEEHCSLDNRAQVVRLLYMEKRVQLCNVYLKSGPEPHEIRFTMHAMGTALFASIKIFLDSWG